jgi:hypothetical protein
MVPAGPFAGETESVGTVTVKVAVPVAAEFPSVAVTVLEPVGAAAGTVNPQTNPPTAEVVIVPADAEPELHVP